MLVTYFTVSPANEKIIKSPPEIQKEKNDKELLQTIVWAHDEKELNQRRGRL